MKNRDYHDLGYGPDPAKVTYGSSMLHRGFSRHGDRNPRDLLRQITTWDADRKKSYDMQMGSVVNLLLLEREEVRSLPPLEWFAELGAQGRRHHLKLPQIHRIGDYLIEPAPEALEMALKGMNPSIKPVPATSATSLLGREQKRALEATAEETGCEFIERRAWEDGCALAYWLSLEENREYLPASAQEARHLLIEAPGVREEAVFVEVGGLKLKAKPDALLDVNGEIVELKRTRHLRGRRFRNEFEREWRMRMAFTEMVLHLAGGPEHRPWVVVTMYDKPVARAYVHPISPEQQEAGRVELHRALADLRLCLETGRWEAWDERHARQTPQGVYAWPVLDEEELAELDELGDEDSFMED